MYAYANGFTKSKVMAAIRAGNKNTRSTIGNYCAYLSPDGNRCFIGCFLPDKHPAQNTGSDVRDLLKSYPELKLLMPFDDSRALTRFQNLHDQSTDPDVDLYALAEKWLTENVQEIA